MGFSFLPAASLHGYPSIWTVGHDSCQAEMGSIQVYAQWNILQEVVNVGSSQ